MTWGVSLSVSLILPFHTVHGVLKARILKWFAISFSRGTSRPRDETWVSCTVGRRFTAWATREASKEWRDGAKAKQHPAVDVTGDGSKVRCCKEQYCIETWNVRSMNQGKLEVVKQEMARVNIDILGISELKWTRMKRLWHWKMNSPGR